MKSIVKRRILGIKPYMPGKPIDEVKRELKLKRAIKLASNETPYGPSPKVLRAIQKQARSINRYPDGGCFYLRAKLARMLKVSEDQLVFGNGSDEIIVLAIRAFVREGDEVVIARPSFLIYDIASRLEGARVKAVPLKQFRYDLARMAKAVGRKTRIVFIGNPDNPSGTYVNKKDLSAFLKKVRKTVLVFIDEAYFEYVTEKDYPDTLNLLKRHKNLIVTRTFSKMYGLAGLRIGYGVTTRETAGILNRLREPFNVNSIAQSAAMACLNDKQYYKKLAKRIESQRSYLCRQLNAIGLNFVRTVTNFMLIDVQVNGSTVAKKLMQKGVIVRDMSFWGLKNYIRTTIGTNKENRLFIKELKSILDK